MSTAPNNPLFEAYYKYGLRKSQVHFASLNYFSIPDEIRDAFPTYFIQYRKTQDFLSQLLDGAINYQGVEYIVVYRRGASRGKILKREQVALSFRQAAPEFGLAAYVLVS